jgi:cytochrome c oxidase subunit I+III
VVVEWTQRTLLRSSRPRRGVAAGVVITSLLGAGALVLSLLPQLQVEPAASAYGAIVWTHLAYQAFHIVVLLAIAVFVLARLAAGLLDVRRRAAWDSLRVLWHYSAAQGVLIVALLQCS